MLLTVLGFLCSLIPTLILISAIIGIYRNGRWLLGKLRRYKAKKPTPTPIVDEGK